MNWVSLRLLDLNISFVKMNINIIEKRQRAVTSVLCVFNSPAAILEAKNCCNIAAPSLDKLSQTFLTSVLE